MEPLQAVPLGTLVSFGQSAGITSHLFVGLPCLFYFSAVKGVDIKETVGEVADPQGMGVFSVAKPMPPGVETTWIHTLGM